MPMQLLHFDQYCVYFVNFFVSSKQVIVNICKQMQRKAGNRTITDGLIETSVKRCTAQATYKHIKQEERVETW